MRLYRYTTPLAVCLLTGWITASQANLPVRIEQAWIPEAPPVATVLAGYMTLNNTDNSKVTITSASSPAFKRVEIHRTVIKDGMARMEQLQTLDISAGERVQLKPGGMHLMLIDPKQPLKQGDVVDVQFTLKDGTRLSARFTVKRSHETASEHHQHH